MSSISLDCISYSYERYGQVVPALVDLTLYIAPNEFVVIGGSNGSGKSTLLRLISGELEPLSGAVRINNHESRHGRPRYHDIFHICQDPTAATVPALSVYENLFIADQSGGKHAARVARYHELLASVDMSHRLHHPCEALSGGERQILSFLVANLRTASVLLLDEPTSSLDFGRSRICLSLIDKLSKAGRTIVMVTHDVGLLSSIGDRTIILSHGRLIYDADSQSRSKGEMHDALVASLSLHVDS